MRKLLMAAVLVCAVSAHAQDCPDVMFPIVQDRDIQRLPEAYLPLPDLTVKMPPVTTVEPIDLNEQNDGDLEVD